MHRLLFPSKRLFFHLEMASSRFLVTSSQAQSSFKKNSYQKQQIQSRENLVPKGHLSSISTKMATTNTLSSELEEVLLTSLSEIVSSENVNRTMPIRMQHGKDASHFKSQLPDIVVWPTSTEQVSKVSKLCYDLNMPITPYGSGTGLEGGVNALQGGVCIALTKMNNVIEINEADFDCTVEAGVTWRELNQQLNGTGLFFPVDPGASASLGGMASTNASGTNAVFYGTMKQNVLNLEVVLPSGEIMKTSGIKARPRKSSAGFNLTELFVGSEGQLGTITKVTTRLYPIPETLCACVCHFEDNKSTIDTVIQLLQNNIPLSRIEYLDKRSIAAANGYSKVNLPVKPSLFLEISGNQANVDSIVKITKEIVSDNGGSSFQHSTKTEERFKLWKARHELAYACSSTRPGHRIMVTDVVVPISKLTEIILQMHQYFDQYNLNAFTFGHVGDGNFHSMITYNENDKDEIGRVFTVAEKIAEDAINLNGTCTGEHGIGRGKMELMRKEFDNTAIEVMDRIKKALDPKGLINAGKVIPPL